MIRFAFLFIVFPLVSYSQDVVRSGGVAQVRLEDRHSLNETKEMALELAKINAIEKAFGSYVEQDSDVDIENGNPNFKIIGNTRVRGEWLKTLESNFMENTRRVKRRKRKNMDEMWITCEVEGLIREIRKPEVVLEMQPRNCVSDLCRTYDFKNGESFYLTFRTPVDGYLSIYMLQEDEKAYCIFPYQAMKGVYKNAVPVKSDHEYLLFSSHEELTEHEGFSNLLVDELFMHTDREKEFIEMYAVFSTEEYIRPLLDSGLSQINESDFEVPESLNQSDFVFWLQENRIHDPEFLYKRMIITIRK